MSDIVTYDSQDHIAIVTINRPEKRNALNAEVGEGLKAAWHRFNAGEDRVAILTGAGDSAFTAGADLREPGELWSFIPNVGVEIEKPLIAAVNGWCIGGGMVLVQFCDLCVIAETARFSYPEAKLGFTGGLISGLVARIPHKVAMELLLVGEEMTAQRAYEVGLVNKVVPADQLMPAALDYAGKLAANAPLVLATIKRFTARVLPKGPSEAAGIARRQTDAVFASEDWEEGRASFHEKRAPAFKGR